MLYNQLSVLMGSLSRRYPYVSLSLHFPCHRRLKFFGKTLVKGFVTKGESSHFSVSETRFSVMVL